MSKNKIFKGCPDKRAPFERVMDTYDITDVKKMHDAVDNKRRLAAYLKDRLNRVN